MRSGASMRLEGRRTRCGHSSEKQNHKQRIMPAPPLEGGMYGRDAKCTVDYICPPDWCHAIRDVASASEPAAAVEQPRRSVTMSTPFSAEHLARIRDDARRLAIRSGRSRGLPRRTLTRGGRRRPRRGNGAGSGDRRPRDRRAPAAGLVVRTVEARRRACRGHQASVRQCSRAADRRATHGRSTRS